MYTSQIRKGTNMNLTATTQKLLKDLAEDAINWDGCPLFDGSYEERGNLTDLKRKKLITTQMDEGCIWVFFTDKGLDLIKELFDIDIRRYMRT